jgi:UDP-glucose 4-epimerase
VIATTIAADHDAIGIDLAPGANTTSCGDFSDAALMRRALAGVDVVVHVAALHVPHMATLDDAAFRRTNVDATKQLVDLALDAGVRRFVYTSSTSVYGHALVPRDRAVWVTEDMAPQPRDIYDETKLAAEAQFEEAARGGAPCTILRFSRCFPEPLPLMALYRAYRGVDARDVAHAHLLAVESTATGAPIYNISARTPFVEADCEALLHDAPSVIERRAPALADWLRAHGEAVPRSIDRVYVAARAEAELGFRPQHDVARFVREHK